MNNHTWRYNKNHYRGMTLPGGYVWGGFDSESGMHMFARQVLQRWQEVELGVSKLVRDDLNGSWHGLWENLFVTDDDLQTPAGVGTKVQLVRLALDNHRLVVQVLLACHALDATGFPRYWH